MALNTPQGLFEDLAMPFGWTNQRCLPVVGNSCDMLNKFLFICLDYILIYSETEVEHVQHIRLILRHLLENKLFVKAEKCGFLISSVFFLGLDQHGQLLLDPVKARPRLRHWRSGPPILSWKQLQQFLRFANFYCWCIRDYSKVFVAPDETHFHPEAILMEQGSRGGFTTTTWQVLERVREGLRFWSSRSAAKYPVCPRLCPLWCPAVGAFVPAGVSPCTFCDVILVTIYGSWCQFLHCCLLYFAFVVFTHRLKNWEKLLLNNIVELLIFNLYGLGQGNPQGYIQIFKTQFNGCSWDFFCL